MMSEGTFQVLADLILLIHFGFVAFVVLGFVAIWIGHFRGWRFVRNFWFRALHLGAMGYVALEAVAGMTCPLTTWEARLRTRAGQPHQYEGSFIQHWVQRFIFFELPEWTFTLVYVGFFALLVLTFWIVRPEPRRGRTKHAEA
jgi:hypothetical protein